ncbi:spore germination protein GerPE [Cohnella abietis]|uniref:spore germination protein GerPE n=1 Tax=Cohnella abietis TaxID=2507935 RepID=UPI00102E2663|nr:spore germination protein GerPE [Cohnella abietis]
MSLTCRRTTLRCLFVNTVSTSGIVQLGDTCEVSLTSKALAVQRAIPDFQNDEFRFASYSIFTRPKLTLQPCNSVAFNSECPLSNIHVGEVRTLGVSASSILRVGCGGPLQAISRIKHIRQYNDPKTWTVAEK